MTAGYPQYLLDKESFRNDQEIKQRYKQDRMDALTRQMNHTPLMLTHITISTDAASDFFALRTLLKGGLGYFVSERLKLTLEKEGITGVEFREVNNGQQHSREH